MTYEPAECSFSLISRFGLLTDPEKNEKVGIILSVLNGRFYRDDIDRNMIKSFPAWLCGRGVGECLYSAPDGWTLEQTKLGLEKIGFIHNPNWDDDYGV